MVLDPIRRLTDDELSSMLDDALAVEDDEVVWRVVKEMERRGEILQV